jgi:hypothetical protein
MKVWSVVVTLAVTVAMLATLQAQDKKEVTLKGSLVCGKCTLAETDQCANVLQVKEGDKTINYFIQDKGKAEKYHKDICPANAKKDATVTGVVSEKDGKKQVKASKVEVK